MKYTEMFIKQNYTFVQQPGSKLAGNLCSKWALPTQTQVLR